MNKYIPQFRKEVILIHVLTSMLVKDLLVKEDPLDTSVSGIQPLPALMMAWIHDYIHCFMRNAMELLFDYP